MKIALSFEKKLKGGIKIRMVGLNKIKLRRRFMFPHNVEKRLGIHGVFWVSVPYSDKITRVRKVSSEKEYMIRSFEKNTLIKDWKTGKKMEFLGKILVTDERLIN
jgi:hypothetical protein